MQIYEQSDRIAKFYYPNIGRYNKSNTWKQRESTRLFSGLMANPLSLKQVSMPNSNYYFKDIFSCFKFGKYEGITLFEVIVQNESYIYWCINHIPDFIISEEGIQQIRNLFPNFIVSVKFENHIGNPFYNPFSIGKED